MTKQISNFHLITQDSPQYSHSEMSEIAYSNGCRWVQLRIKHQPESVIVEEAQKAMITATKHHGLLIINDNPHIAAQVGAHGVHLGKSDMKVAEARKILGDDAIIGGTANTLDDILNLIDQKADYIGLGPFRFTTTKEKLSPILGMEGYKTIMNRLAETKLSIPIVAIGGITPNDVRQIMDAGLHGIAISGAIDYTGFPDSFNTFTNLLNNR